MRVLRSAAAWIAAVLLLAIALLLAEFGWLFRMDHSYADRLGATGAILGGLIGAGGAALAVYLTIIAQREDEAKKVEASLRAEVVEFARLAMAPLDVMARFVLPGERPMPVQDLRRWWPCLSPWSSRPWPTGYRVCPTGRSWSHFMRGLPKLSRWLTSTVCGRLSRSSITGCPFT